LPNLLGVASDSLDLIGVQHCAVSMLKVPESHILVVLAFATLAPSLAFCEFQQPIPFVQMSMLAPVYDLGVFFGILGGGIFDNFPSHKG
jgi:hypothetical protein